MERRYSQQKELVLNAVLDLKGHVSAKQVHDEVIKTNPNVSLGTVYRNLSILSDEGKIKKIEIPNGSDFFDFRLDDHYHIQCTKCKELHDLEIEYHDLLKKVSNLEGFKVVGYDILFKGICPKCLAAANHH